MHFRALRLLLRERLLLLRLMDPFRHIAQIGVQPRDLPIQPLLLLPLSASQHSPPSLLLRLLLQPLHFLAVASLVARQHGLLIALVQLFLLGLVSLVQLVVLRLQRRVRDPLVLHEDLVLLVLLFQLLLQVLHVQRVHSMRHLGRSNALELHDRLVETLFLLLDLLVLRLHFLRESAHRLLQRLQLGLFALELLLGELDPLFVLPLLFGHSTRPFLAHRLNRLLLRFLQLPCALDLRHSHTIVVVVQLRQLGERVLQRLDLLVLLFLFVRPRRYIHELFFDRFELLLDHRARRLQLQQRLLLRFGPLDDQVVLRVLLRGVVDPLDVLLRHVQAL